MFAVRRDPKITPAKLLPLNALALLSAAAGLSQAAVLPDGPGKTETTKLCGKCHSLDMATSLRQTQEGWAETISKMVNLGAEGSQDELNAVLKYLVKNYLGTAGPATARSGGATAAPASTSATTAAARVAPAPAVIPADAKQ